MKRSIWILVIGFSVYGCGSESGDPTSTFDENGYGESASDPAEGTIDTGSIAIDLPGSHGSGRATCSLRVTRAVEKSLASVNLILDVIGQGCDGMGNCENPNMKDGDINYSGGIDGDNPFATMILHYDPPSASEEETLWMYNAIYKTAPFSRFDLRVDGAPFNPLTSDTKGAEDLMKGPQMWNIEVDIEADMVRSSATDDQSTPPLQTLGKFSYQGPCETVAFYIQGE